MPATEKSSAVGESSAISLPSKIRVSAMVKQLENFTKQLTTSKLEEYDEAELSVRLDYLEAVNSSFDKAQSEVEQHDRSELESDDRVNFTMMYLDVKSKLTRQFNSTRKFESNHRSSTIRQFSLDDESPTHSRKIRLPELQIPKFYGSYSDWPNFFSLFAAVIHDNAELTKLEKFHHLRASLGDAALDTISSLELGEANYDKALSLLKNRFDNKLLNFQNHIKNIFELKEVENDSATGLRRLSDKINAHLRAVQTIGSKEQIADGILIYLVGTKLDAKSQAKWEETLPINELPSWSAMSSFLDRRSRMLENIENSMLTRKTTHQQGHKKTSLPNRHVLVSSSRISCSFCDSKDHFITSCSTFGNLSPSLRFKEAKRLKLCLNCLRKGHVVKKCNSGNCRVCSLKHHTMLHMNDNSLNRPAVPPVAEQTASSSQSVLISKSSNQSIVGECSSNTSTLLATALILVRSSNGMFLPCRAILDSASQLNLITRRFAKHLNLQPKSSSTIISGVGDGTLIADQSVEIIVKSQYVDYVTTITTMVVPTITNYQPNFNINTPGWTIPNNIKLADPCFHKSGSIDVLVGAELFFKLMSVGQIKISENMPILQKTIFGWVVAGGGHISPKSFSLTISCNEPSHKVESLSNIIKGFWETENNFGVVNLYSNEDQFCENHFVQNTIRLPSGAYSVLLPKQNDCESLGDSYERALRRFTSLEIKFRKYPEIKTQYIAFMREYADLNHMSLISPQVACKRYYLPHHCVQKLSSTTPKLRVVFDGSAKTTNGVSLNDILFAGPSVQPRLFNTLLRYRFFKIALSGDICKMYRCVKVSHPDDYLQCIIWRENETDELNIYKLNTVTYGTKPAAFLAIRAMHQLAEDEGKDFPIAAKVIKQDFYVDDMLCGGDTAEEVTELRLQVAALLQKGKFQIRKWCSNEQNILDDVPTEDCEQFLEFDDGTSVTKTLGLLWDPKCDNFIFSFTPLVSTNVTKRSVLSIIGRIYDPLGLIGPVITKAKIFMQHLWKLKLNWDESLPQSLHAAWLEYVSKFSSVSNFKFQRYVTALNSRVQIHAFCDASLSAYGTCVYVRSETNEEIKVSLLCSKSRVAPLNTLTVPKLELAAALLLAELLNEIVKTIHVEAEFHCWSDSMVVLSWLRQQPSEFNIFVSNRVARIQELTNRMIWHFVPTILNPADILSRGATPEELLYSTTWKFGPEYLRYESSKWPDKFEFLTDLPERRGNILVMSKLDDLTECSKYRNSFFKMQRIFAYVFKFIHRKKGHLTPNDIKMGTQILIRNIQLINFAAEYKALTMNKEISSSSRIHSLDPFIDSIGLIRVGGRLQNSDLDYEAQHPIIIPQHHPFTKALVIYYHEKFLHSGPQCLLASIRQQFWPIGGRKNVSAIISKCLRCFRLKPILKTHIMGSLPSDRVRPSRTFYSTGIDFCGPFFYKTDVRNRPPVKCYVCIFVCFSTKASHLEIVQDLSTASFLSALRRFIAIRGKPRTIWSDNATNFVGAKNELADLRQLFLSQSHQQMVIKQCLEDNIEWKFIPPRSPHFGGLWEAAVKSAKLHFYRSVGLSKLTFDELRTLVCQISAILNSRPLCPISEDPNDLDTLTPGHFLIGGPLTSISEPDLGDIDVGRLSRWQRVSNIHQLFWKKWSSSYLSLLQERSKWCQKTPNITTGALVLLKDENMPPLKWPLGRIVDVILGDDGVIRVVNVRTCSGIVKRAVSKIAILPIDDFVESSNLPTGGGCSPQVRPCSAR